MSKQMIAKVYFGSLGALTMLMFLVSAVGGVAAWLAVLVDARIRSDQSVAVLLVGLLSLGFFGTLIDVLAGPQDEPVPAFGVLAPPTLSRTPWGTEP